jgi:predicted MFS family arabinose efflux permease
MLLRGSPFVMLWTAPPPAPECHGYTAFQDLAYGLTGPLAGLLADRAGYDSVFLIGAAAATAGLLIALCLRRAQNLVPSNPEVAERQSAFRR